MGIWNFYVDSLTFTYNLYLSFYIIRLMDAAQLSRWTRFASKGGIGKCIAQQDCVAREPDDLMFLKVTHTHSLSCFHSTLSLQDDEIIVLMQLTEEDGIYLVRLLRYSHRYSHMSFSLGILRRRRRSFCSQIRSLQRQTQDSCHHQTFFFPLKVTPTALLNPFSQAATIPGLCSFHFSRSISCCFPLVHRPEFGFTAVTYPY